MQNLYSIYDIKAETYAPPFVAETDYAAKRMILEVLQDSRSMLAKYPADFELRCLCQWASDSAIFVPNQLSSPLVVETVEQILLQDIDRKKRWEAFINSDTPAEIPDNVKEAPNA